MAQLTEAARFQPSWFNPVILLTVGTTMPFDELLEELDRFAQLGDLEEDIVCQSGQSAYQMRTGMQFISRASIADLIAESSLVITHGGSTVIQLLLAKRPFVAFPNPRGAGDHQTHFLSQVSKVADISWSQDVSDLSLLIAQRRELGPARIREDFPSAASIIRSL
jgi:UDP-N-acetylglucosamine transferase subunit ALG13